MNYTPLLQTAIQASIAAGEKILEVYESDFAIEHKEDKSPLTLADKKAHEIISSLLRDSAIPILSEEGKNIPYMERKNWEYFWLVDPLDGTKEFIKRNGEFTVNIALIEKNKPVLGVIYVPVQKILYFATKSMGAFKTSNINYQTLNINLSELTKKSEMLPIISNRTR